MSTDLRIVVPNRPGTLAAALDAIAGAGVGVDGFCGDLRPGETWGYVHVLVEDPSAARAAIEAAGFQVAGEHEVEVVDIEHRTGGLAEAVRRYTDAGQNMEVAYMATESRLVIGTEDMRKEIPGVRVGDAR